MTGENDLNKNITHLNEVDSPSEAKGPGCQSQDSTHSTSFAFDLQRDEISSSRQATQQLQTQASEELRPIQHRCNRLFGCEKKEK